MDIKRLDKAKQQLERRVAVRALFFPSTGEQPLRLKQTGRQARLSQPTPYGVINEFRNMTREDLLKAASYYAVEKITALKMIDYDRSNRYAWREALAQRMLDNMTEFTDNPGDR